MAQIGLFTKKTDGSYSGIIRTLTINAKVTLEVQPAGKENTPSHKVLVNDIEVGAAWHKTSKENRSYLSLKIDDPSFALPLYASLTATDNDKEFALIWNRPGTAKQTRS